MNTQIRKSLLQWYERELGRLNNGDGREEDNMVGEDLPGPGG